MKNRHLLCVLSAFLLCGCVNPQPVEPKTYTITFQNDNKAVLETKTVEEGTVPTCSVTPTKASDSNYDYSFKEWNPTPYAADKDQIYVATYTQTEKKKDTYTITFKNYDGSVLQTLTKVEKGVTPEYTADTPTKPEDDSFIYTFDGWTPAIVPAVADATYTATYKATEKSSTEDLGVKTVAEVRALCEQLTGLNEGGIAVDMTRKVTIKALPLFKFSTEKTAKPYNLSTCYKTIFGDASGYIFCASPKSSDGNTLWGKVADYCGSTAKYYEITGYLTMYMNQPELYVPEKTFEMKDNSGVVSYNVENYSAGNLSLDQFYEQACATKYNMKGHGYGKFYTVKDVKCVDKRENVYIFTNGTSVMKVVKGLSAGFSVGQVYDITGYISLQYWMPAFYAFSAKTSANSVPNLTKAAAINTTIVDFRKNKSSQDDSKYNFSSYINLFKNVYVAKVYATAIQQSGKLYVCVGDKFDTHTEYITGHGVGQTQYNMIEISNDNYWNVTEEEIGRFCPIAPWFNENESFDFYFSPYYQEWYDKKPVWKVFAYNELILAE